MRAKKADVNWMLIMMVLALIVLAITAYIFYSQSKKSTTTIGGLSSCASRGAGAHCDANCKTGEIGLYNFSDCTNQYCCIPP